MSIEIAQSWGRLVVAPKEIVAENLFEDPNEADTIVHPVHLTCVYIHAVGMITKCQKKCTIHRIL